MIKMKNIVCMLLVLCMGLFLAACGNFGISSAPTNPRGHRRAGRCVRFRI